MLEGGIVWVKKLQVQGSFNNRHFKLLSLLFSYDMVSQALQENTSSIGDADSGYPRPDPAISARKPPPFRSGPGQYSGHISSDI